ncbi:MAG: cytochrome c [Pseudomonadota bacterium]
MTSPKPYDLKRHLPSTTFVLIALVVVSAFAGIFTYAGIYNIGADQPHSKFVYNTLDMFRERAVKHHARGIVAPPDLNSQARIATGAGLYNEMCSGCHQGPGLEKTDLAAGLYPQAPQLARGDGGHTPGEQFWTIKHGVKLSAMPAWGRTHNDQLIWDMVAFLQKLPKLTPEQYKAIVASAPSDEEAMETAMPEMAGKKGNSGMKPAAGTEADEKR